MKRRIPHSAFRVPPSPYGVDEMHPRPLPLWLTFTASAVMHLSIGAAIAAVILLCRL